MSKFDDTKLAVMCMAVAVPKQGATAYDCALGIAQYIRDEYEKELASRNEDIGRLQGELRTMQARIAELGAQHVATVEAIELSYCLLLAEISQHFQRARDAA